jgi:hypothetical protein
MLAIVDRFALARFTSCEQVRISAAANGAWLGAHHAAQHQLSGSDFALCHAHHPIDAPELIASTVSGVLQVLEKSVRMEHQHPVVDLAVQRVHRRLVWQP